MIGKIKRARLAIIAAVAGAAIMIGISAPAALATQPSESNNWAKEIEANVPVRSADTISEGHDPNGNLMQVWRGFDNNYIYVSYNHRTAERFESSQSGTIPQTFVAPSVIWTDFGWRIFHTGTDGHVYYAGMVLNASGSITGWGNWISIPNASTAAYETVSPVALPNGAWYATWGGATNTNIYGIYFNGTTYGAIQTIPHAASISPPTLAYDPSWGAMVVVWRDLSNGVGYARQPLGGQWLFVNLLPGISTNERPTIGLANNGAGLISARNTEDNNRLYTIAINRSGWHGTWQAESTGWTSDHAVLISAIGYICYMVLTGYDGQVWWKEVANLQGYGSTRHAA
ncbi:hypothetical protein ACFYY2_01190 [Streptomyces sp. NPDC001822]|uniref:hypothetical protein n=1 Tax=Streptomyces sp. NPDC001822 TaxID=3364614 RepID=UPI0036AD5EDF